MYRILIGELVLRVVRQAGGEKEVNIRKKIDRNPGGD